MRTARVAACGLLLALGAMGTPAHARRRAAITCPPARYVLDTPVTAGTTELRTVDVGTQVRVDGACAHITPTVRATRSGAPRLRARWAACAGLTGTIRLKATLVDDCTRLVGVLRGRKLKRRLAAVRADCGDGVTEAVAPATPYTGTTASLATHAEPRWFGDAKFGIMIHWGMFAVPAWAETVLDPTEWLADGLRRLLEPPDYGREWFVHIPYTEWYANTILIDGSPAQAYHRATYGADFPYENFRPQFETASAAWAAAPWADLFRDAGARYVVLVTKHHDGFALWPTEVPHPARPGWHATRDVVGELSAAVRQRCLRMGLYYSGGLDWSVRPGPIASLLDLGATLPTSPAYIAYADAQWQELIARYQPALLWNDIGYPNDADELALFARYYNTVPDGVINDRFTIIAGLTHHDYLTPEFTVLSDISARKFETVRGMARGFGYNRNDDDSTYDSAAALIHLLIDVVSKNGNLLLNVGPRADGSIPDAQRTRLQAMGQWLGINGSAIYGTRPWTRAAGMTADGTPVRFTQSADRRTVYALVLGPLPAPTVTLLDLALSPDDVRLLGQPGLRPAAREGNHLRVELPVAVAAKPAYVLAIGAQ